ncbi:MAG: hypothetical protein HQ546_07535, partial [Planctomycetes bacterium]|nr:hypothetical protein [Planctomycetota bacterium]
LSFVLGKAICLALAPVTFRIGYAMIHQLGLADIIRRISNTPILALLDLHVYCLLAALPIIAVVGGALAWSAAKLLVKTQAAIAATTGSSDKLQKIARNKAVRVLMRIAFGKQKKTLAEIAENKPSLIRKGRLIAALIVIGLLVVLQAFFLDRLVKVGLTRYIAAVNGAEVDLEGARLSLGSGQLVLDGLQVTDASRPTHNLLQAGRIVADVSISDMLARRFVVDLVECKAMRTDIERERPGEVYRQGQQPETKAPPIWGDLKEKLGKGAEYYEQIKRFNDRLRKLREFLKSDEPKIGSAMPDKDDMARRAKTLGYLKCSAKDYLAKHPTWVIRRAQVSQVEIRPDLPTFTIEGSDLSSHPSLLPEKMQLSARPDEEALKAFLTHLAEGRTGKSDLIGEIMGTKKDADKKPIKSIFDKVLK